MSSALPPADGSTSSDAAVQQRTSLQCGECGREFADATCLRRHCKHAHNSTSTRFQCGQCVSWFSREDSLTQHHRDVHGFNHTCHLCPRVVVEPSVPVRVHMRTTHHLDRIYTCVCCNWSFLNRGDLNYHNKVMKATGEAGRLDPIAVGPAESETPTEPVLTIPFQPSREHNTDGPATEPLYQCKLCGAFLVRKSTLRRHCQQKHGSEYTCHRCNCRIDPTEYNGFRHIIYAHMSKHMVSRILICTCCNWFFETPTGLSCHETSMATTGEPGDVEPVATCPPKSPLPRNRVKTPPIQSQNAKYIPRSFRVPALPSRNEPESSKDKEPSSSARRTYRVTYIKAPSSTSRQTFTCECCKRTFATQEEMSAHIYSMVEREASILESAPRNTRTDVPGIPNDVNLVTVQGAATTVNSTADLQTARDTFCRSLLLESCAPVPATSSPSSSSRQSTSSGAVPIRRHPVRHTTKFSATHP